MNIQATAGIADHEQGLASGLVNTSFQVGGAIVLAVVAAVIGTGVVVDPAALVAEIETLAKAGVDVAGPYKSDHYRY